MPIPDTYLEEEQPEGEAREFWVETFGQVRHTLELQDNGDSISVCLWSEVTDMDGPEWESRTALRITFSDARKLIARLVRLCDKADHATGCDFAVRPADDQQRLDSRDQ